MTHAGPSNRSGPTTGVTLSGDELDPEDDPHDPETRVDDSDTSIYPITSTIRVTPHIERGKRPVSFTLAFEIPFGVDTLPTSRVDEARSDLRDRLDLDSPPVGEIGEVTFTERGHHIDLYPEDERDALAAGEWLMQRFHFLLEQASSGHFEDTDIPISAVQSLQDTIHEHVPGRFETVGGECDNCGATIEEEAYLKPGNDQAHVMCDCGIGTSYPIL